MSRLRILFSCFALRLWSDRLQRKSSESEKGQSLFFNYFSCFLISIKLERSFTPKPYFISQTGSLCQSPFGPLPQITKPPIRQKRTIPLFSAGHPKDGVVPHRPGVREGPVLLCYPISPVLILSLPHKCSVASDFTLFPVFRPPFSSVCFRSRYLVK